MKTPLCHPPPTKGKRKSVSPPVAQGELQGKNNAKKQMKDTKKLKNRQ